jgi:hypothetical protein
MGEGWMRDEWGREKSTRSPNDTDNYTASGMTNEIDTSYCFLFLSQKKKASANEYESGTMIR